MVSDSVKKISKSFVHSLVKQYIDTPPCIQYSPKMASLHAIAKLKTTHLNAASCRRRGVLATPSSLISCLTDTREYPSTCQERVEKKCQERANNVSSTCLSRQRVSPKRGRVLRCPKQGRVALNTLARKEMEHSTRWTRAPHRSPSYVALRILLCM